MNGLVTDLFYQYYCLRVNRVYTEINNFPAPFSKRLFKAIVFNIKIVNTLFNWKKFMRTIRE